MPTSNTFLLLFPFFLTTSFAHRCSNHIQIFKNYTCVQETPIGVGSEGRVYLVESMHKQYILKVQNISKTSQNELSILAQLKKKPYIVQLINYKKYESKMYMIISLGSQGTLGTFLANSEYLSSYSNVIKFINQLLIGLQEIHKAGFVHADLKPDNIVIDENNNPLIIDFDVSVRINQLQPPRGTLEFMPPEIVQHFIFEEDIRYTPDMDIYSLGAIFYLIIKQTVPIEMKALRYLKMLESEIKFEKGDYRNFYDFVSNTVQMASNRIGVREAEFMMKEMQENPFSEKLKQGMSYKLKDFADETEKLTNEYENKNVIIMFLVLLVVFTLGLVYIVKKIKKKFFTKKFVEHDIFEDLRDENKI